MSEIEKAVRLIQGVIMKNGTEDSIEIDRDPQGVEDIVEWLEALQEQNSVCKPLVVPPEIIRTLASWPGDGYGPEIRAVLEAARKAVA